VKSISGKQFAKILEKHGWHLVRVNGSHHVYMKPGGGFGGLLFFSGFGGFVNLPWKARRLALR
jgi:hypothetical protein